MQHVQAYWTRATSWLGRQSRTARIGLGVGAVLVFLVGCSLGALVASGGKSSGSPLAASTATLASRATATPAPTHAPTATAKPKSWVTVKHLSGSGNSQSDSFAVKDGDHVVSNCTGPSDGNLFIASLYRQGQTPGTDLPYADLVDQANQPCAQATYTIQGGDVSVYLTVQADSVQWTVDVQRYE